MEKLYDWEAQRSGTRMRIIGKDAEGAAVKITKVEAISVHGEHIYARDSDNTLYQLGRPLTKETARG